MNFHYFPYFLRHSHRYLCNILTISALWPPIQSISISISLLIFIKIQIYSLFLYFLLLYAHSLILLAFMHLSTTILAWLLLRCLFTYFFVAFQLECIDNLQYLLYFSYFIKQSHYSTLHHQTPRYQINVFLFS